MKSKMNVTYKSVWIIAYPILVSLLMEQLIGMTDTAFLGRVGEIELGASALAGVYYLAIFMLGFGFSLGAQILIARRNGEQEFKQIGQIFYQGTIILLLLAVCMFSLSRIFSARLLSAVIESESVQESALQYINWRVYGFFFSFTGVMFRAFFVGTTQTKTLTANSLVMVLSNVLFNYVLIFGKLGFPALGIAGAAIGSSLAELMSVLFFIIYTIRRVDIRKYGLDIFQGLQKRVIKQILNVSLWTMIQNFISLSTWFFFFVAVEHLGERPLAITNIIRSIASILFTVTIAFASTCGSLVSNFIGAGESNKVGQVIKICIQISYMILVPLGILFSVFPEMVIRIYTNNYDLVTASVPSLWVMCTAYFFLVPGNILFQSVSGTGNIKTAFLLEILTIIVYVAYVTYMIFYRRVDVAFCWTTEHVYGITIMIACYWYLKKGHWQNKKI
ncbi:MAG: MATE family efflux transporter [Tannerellaceae bacterium]|nr:MATE family efflux transporter [Tannerellaceae bacterium]